MPVVEEPWRQGKLANLDLSRLGHPREEEASSLFALNGEKEVDLTDPL